MTIKIRKAKKTKKSKEDAEKESKPDYLLHAVLEAFDVMPRQFQEALVKARGAYHTAYHTAKRLYDLMTLHHNFLLAHVKSKGMSIEDWIDQGMAPLKAIKKLKPHDLIKAVGEGMTYKQFLGHGLQLNVFLDGTASKARKQRLEHSSVPADPKKTMGDADAAAQLRIANKVLRALVTDLKAELAEERGLREAGDKELKKFHKIQKLAAG